MQQQNSPSGANSDTVPISRPVSWPWQQGYCIHRGGINPGIPLLQRDACHKTDILLRCKDFIWQCGQPKIYIILQLRSSDWFQLRRILLQTYTCLAEEIVSLGIGCFSRCQKNGSVVMVRLLCACVSGLSLSILNFRRAQIVTLYCCNRCNQPYSRASCMCCICWHLCAPFGFALHTLQSTTRSDTDGSIIRTIINVTFSFQGALHQPAHSQLIISAEPAVPSQNNVILYQIRTKKKEKRGNTPWLNLKQISALLNQICMIVM